MDFLKVFIVFREDIKRYFRYQRANFLIFAYAKHITTLDHLQFFNSLGLSKFRGLQNTEENKVELGGWFKLQNFYVYGGFLPNHEVINFWPCKLADLFQKVKNYFILFYMSARTVTCQLNPHLPTAAEAALKT